MKQRYTRPAQRRDPDGDMWCATTRVGAACRGVLSHVWNWNLWRVSSLKVKLDRLRPINASNFARARLVEDTSRAKEPFWHMSCLPDR